MLTNFEHMESDELQKMGTGSNANKRESDQPEELAAKEPRVEDVAMDQGPQDASATKARRMHDMLINHFIAVSCGTSRVCVNEEKYKASNIQRIARRPRQEGPSG